MVDEVLGREVVATLHFPYDRREVRFGGEYGTVDEGVQEAHWLSYTS